MTTDATAEPMMLRFEPDACANCFRTLPEDTAHRPVLFCSNLCRDYAHTVRYWRKAQRTGSLTDDAGVREALGTRIAHLLAGGYNSMARRIPPETRSLVIERDKVCVRCGAPGQEIDHIVDDSNDPKNLQYLCLECHHAKTRSHMVPASVEQGALIDDLERTRVMPVVPVQLCDDETFWADAERVLRKERSERLKWPDVDLESSAQLIAEIRASAGRRPDLGDLETDDHEARGEDDDSGFGENSYFARAMARDD